MISAFAPEEARSPWERGRPARMEIRGPAARCGRDARAPRVVGHDCHVTPASAAGRTRRAGRPAAPARRRRGPSSAWRRAPVRAPRAGPRLAPRATGSSAARSFSNAGSVRSSCCSRAVGRRLRSGRAVSRCSLSSGESQRGASAAPVQASGTISSHRRVSRPRAGTFGVGNGATAGAPFGVGTGATAGAPFGVGTGAATEVPIGVDYRSHAPEYRSALAAEPRPECRSELAPEPRLAPTPPVRR